MTASPPLNGHKRPAITVLGDWQPVAPEPAEEQRTPEPSPAAEAETARAKAWAEAEERRVAAEAGKEERRIKAAAEAEAIRARAEEEARRLRLANDRAERKDREAAAASGARIAEANRKREEADQAREDARRHAAERRRVEQQAAKEIEAADNKWRSYAIRFAIVCGIVSLPVQMSFFWNPQAPWMAAAPIMLEGAAWVVHRGARAAAVSKRPVWHYRTIVWLLALVAADVNLYHGLHSFDPGTAVATAFASIAGPGVWDLHEHGRIRKRDGALTRRERKAEARAAKAEAKRKAAEEEQRAAERKTAEQAAEKARTELRETRQQVFGKVWEEAVKIGAALGKAPDDPAVWPRAYRNIEGTEPGESIESITARRTAEKRVQAALTGTPVNTLSKTTSAQRNPQMMRGGGRGSKTGPKVRGVRRSGDTQKYHPIAGQLASEAKRKSITNARQKDPS